MNHTQLQLLGHATLRITTPENKVIIVDPWFTGNDFIPEHLRVQENVDMMIITHGHEDHFDKNLPEMIERLRPVIVANSIVRFYLYERFVDKSLIEPMNLGGTINVMDVTVSMVAAQHLGHIMIDRDSIGFTHPSVGFVLRFSDGITLYIAGDTGIFSDMSLIGEIYHPHLAVLPIGGRYTMGPQEALHAIRLLKVPHVVPYHYGTFETLIKSPKEFSDLVNTFGNTQVHVLQAGQVLDCNEILRDGV